MKKFKVIGGNCPRRKVDAQTIQNYFLANDYICTDNTSAADYIIIFTCGGFDSSELMSLNTIKVVYKQRKKNALMIVTGCLLLINYKCIPMHDNMIHVNYEEFSKVDLIISASKKFSTIPVAGVIGTIPDLHEKITPKTFLKYLPVSKIRAENLLIALRAFKKNIIGAPSSPFSNKGIYNVLIARGCLGDCSYCAIRLAHGRVKSKPMEEVLNSFRNGLNEGYKKFVFIAEDSGAYGVDQGYTFPELLKNVFELSSEFKLILNDINPRWLIKYFNQLLPLLEKYQDRIIDIRLPIQSGSNDILKKMRRHYDIEKVQECFDELHKILPNLEVRTHVIVGFPGETDDDFLKTVNFLKKNMLAGTMVYRYEDRFCCDSFKLPGKVSKKKINQRRNMLKRI